MTLVKKNSFEKLIDNVYQTHCYLQLDAQKAVNQNLTIRNWLIGYYIVEFEQEGEDRAKYGTRLLEEMAKKIKEKAIKGLDIKTLRTCRIFYNTYPQIRGSVTAELQHIENKRLTPFTIENTSIRGSATRELQNTENKEDKIRGSLTRELEKAFSVSIQRIMSERIGRRTPNPF